jgi:hypothetical protein
VLYSVFGLNLDSDLPLAASGSSSGQHADITFTAEWSADSRRRCQKPGEAVWYQSTWIDDASGAPGLVVYRSDADAGYRMCYGDGMEFGIDAEARRIIGRAPAPATVADVVSYLTGPVLGIVLRIRGVVALHASAIEVNGRAVLLGGAACSGKSTSAAALAGRGFKVITEDIAALSIAGETRVLAGCAEVSLRPDAAAALYGSAEALPRFSESWDKRRLDLAQMGAFAARSVPLGAVYMLTNTSGVPNAPCVLPTSPGEAMAELLANVYANRVLHDELRLQELNTVHHVVSSVPVKAVATGARPELVSRFCDVLLADLG